MRDIILYASISFVAILFINSMLKKEEMPEQVETSSYQYSDLINPPSLSLELEKEVQKFMDLQFTDLDKQQLQLSKALDKENGKLILLFTAMDCIRCFDAVFKEIKLGIDKKQIQPNQLLIIGVFDNQRHITTILNDHDLTTFPNIWRIKEQDASRFSFLQDSPLLISLNKANELSAFKPIDKSDLLASTTFIQSFFKENNQ